MHFPDQPFRIRTELSSNNSRLIVIPSKKHFLPKQFLIVCTDISLVNGRIPSIRLSHFYHTEHITNKDLICLMIIFHSMHSRFFFAKMIIMYTLIAMVTIQKKISLGHTNWQIVESRRIGGKLRPVVLMHLGTTKGLLRRLQEGRKNLKSSSHLKKFPPPY